MNGDGGTGLVSEWWPDVEPVICGFYRMTPAAAGALTPAEVVVMLDGADWIGDREWERAAFALMDGKAAKKILDARYPRYRTDRKARKPVKHFPGAALAGKSVEQIQEMLKVE